MLDALCPLGCTRSAMLCSEPWEPWWGRFQPVRGWVGRAGHGGGVMRRQCRAVLIAWVCLLNIEINPMLTHADQAHSMTANAQPRLHCSHCLTGRQQVGDGGAVDHRHGTGCADRHGTGAQAAQPAGGSRQVGGAPILHIRLGHGGQVVHLCVWGGSAQGGSG